MYLEKNSIEKDNMLLSDKLSQLLLDFSKGEIDKNSAKIKDLWEKKIILYGFGNVGRRLLPILVESGIEVVAILDQNPDVTTKRGTTTIFHPEDKEVEQLKRSCHIIISALFSAKICAEIKKYLSRLKFQHIHTLNEIDFGEVTKRSYYETSYDGSCTKIKIIEKEKSKIFNSFDMLQSTKDQELFIAYLKSHLTFDFTQLPKPENSSLQYLAHDIPQQTNFSNFIDCGSYDGDTIRQLLDSPKKINNLMAFEPQTALYDKLATYVAEQHKTFQTSFLFPCGLYSETTKLNFSVTQSSPTSGGVDCRGKSVIQCVKLDDVVHGFKPSFIKMDIEGSELAALMGSQRTIRESLPQLAICIYHSLSHLWDIPILIHKYSKNYKFYLRSYNSMSMETVLYGFHDSTLKQPIR